MNYPAEIKIALESTSKISNVADMVQIGLNFSFIFSLLLTLKTFIDKFDPLSIFRNFRKTQEECCNYENC